LSSNLKQLQLTIDEARSKKIAIKLVKGELWPPRPKKTISGLMEMSRRMSHQDNGSMNLEGLDEGPY